MAEPTCASCGRPSAACRSFEGKGCWQARALMLDRKLYQLEVAASAGVVGQVVAGRCVDGMVHYTIEFPDDGLAPGVGATVRVARVVPRPEVSRG